MNDVAFNLLKQAVETKYGGESVHVEAVPVTITLRSKIIWQGIVHTFEFARHPHPKRVYAWSSPIRDSSQRRVSTIVHGGLVYSPEAAVRTKLKAIRATREE